MINNTKFKLRETLPTTKECYLIGGGEYNDKVEKKVETKILQRITNSSVLIIPWTSDDTNTLKKYHKIIFQFFKRLKAKRIIFLEKPDSQKDTKKKFAEANIVYLPGGETDTLLKNIKSKKIIDLLRNFNGVIVGVSAGAYILTNGYIKTQNTKNFFVPALKMINIFIKAHYTKEMDKFLLKFSQNKDIYGIPNNSALVFRDNRVVEVIGKVYRFVKGKKSKLTINRVSFGREGILEA